MTMSDSRQCEAARGATLRAVELDDDCQWRAVESGDARFDGWFFCGVTSTGIYCRPSCPARTPKPKTVRFFSAAAAAQAAGFRACKRCRPDATPGSPEWDRRGDLVGRAMRLIADGVVDREGVTGLARELAYTPRHVHRELVAVVGAGPLALARAQRAQTARVLLETTDVSVTGIAFAAGFQSVRQFNSTIRAVFAATPSELRHRRQRGEHPESGGAIALRLPYRAPYDGDGMFAFFAARLVPGLEEIVDGAYRRSLALPRGTGTVELSPGPDHVHAQFRLQDLRDLGPAVQRCRLLLDLDSDPLTVANALGADPLLGPSVTVTPGRRVPGSVDGDELAVRAMLGQQVTVASATTLAGQLVEALGDTLPSPLGGVTHVFPSPASVADADPNQLRLPAARRRSLLGLCAALASRDITLDVGAERVEARRRLLALPGIGPWTTEYIAMRALRDPDAFPASDLGVRRALAKLGRHVTTSEAHELAEAWRPYRAYATQYLWAQLSPPARHRAPKRSRHLAA